MAIEKPQYKVLKKAKNFEIREYQEHWLAECRVDKTKDLNLASNRAFTQLFNYITGENEPRQKIAMTSPVQQVESEDGWLVSFVVPSSFKPDQIPQPLNSRIQLRKVPAGRFAALRYSGFWNNQVFETKSSELLATAKLLGFKPTGSVSSAVYNPPLTPPFLRRNEVIVSIED